MRLHRFFDRLIVDGLFSCLKDIGTDFMKTGETVFDLAFFLIMNHFREMNIMNGFGFIVSEVLPYLIARIR